MLVVRVTIPARGRTVHESIGLSWTEHRESSNANVPRSSIKFNRRSAVDAKRIWRPSGAFSTETWSKLDEEGSDSTAQGCSGSGEVQRRPISATLNLSKLRLRSKTFFSSSTFSIVKSPGLLTEPASEGRPASPRNASSV